MSSLILSLFGTIHGIWSKMFHHIAAVPNCVITQLSFLLETFYSIGLEMGLLIVITARF
jgi:hypothetical protein